MMEGKPVKVTGKSAVRLQSIVGHTDKHSKGMTSSVDKTTNKLWMSQNLPKGYKTGHMRNKSVALVHVEEELKMMNDMFSKSKSLSRQNSKEILDTSSKLRSGFPVLTPKRGNTEVLTQACTSIDLLKSGSNDSRFASFSIRMSTERLQTKPCQKLSVLVKPTFDQLKSIDQNQWLYPDSENKIQSLRKLGPIPTFGRTSVHRQGASIFTPRETVLNINKYDVESQLLRGRQQLDAYLQRTIRKEDWTRYPSCVVMPNLDYTDYYLCVRTGKKSLLADYYTSDGNRVNQNDLKKPIISTDFRDAKHRVRVEVLLDTHEIQLKTDKEKELLLGIKKKRLKRKINSMLKDGPTLFKKKPVYIRLTKDEKLTQTIQNDESVLVTIKKSSSSSRSSSNTLSKDQNDQKHSPAGTRFR